MAFFGEFLAAVTLLFIATWIYFKQKYKHIEDVISPPGLPILGNALDIRSTTTLIGALRKYTETYGGFIKVNVGPFRKMCVVTDYKILEVILTSQKFLDKSDEYHFLSPWLGTGLLTSTAQKWKKHRRIITPTFHFQILEQFIDVFEECGQTLIDKLQKQSGNKSLDIYPFITLCTLDIICETAMGTKINAQNIENSEYVWSVKQMCRIVVERTVSILQRYDYLFPLTQNYYTQHKALKNLQGHTNEVIVQKRKEKEEANQNKTEESTESADSLGIKKKKAFLDMLLDATVDGQPLSQEDIREEVDTFMFEGHDTTASAISFAIFCIANHPEVQKQILEEQIELFGNEKSPQVTLQDLQNMKYLELVIKETLRMYPSVPLFGRISKESVSYDGGVIPHGVSLLIFAFGVLRNPKYFKDPDTFNPNRFTEIDGTQPFAYLPFSAGPRNCIGQKFAMLEMKSTLSKIVRHFELSASIPTHNLVLASEAVLKSANGVRIGIQARK